MTCIKWGGVGLIYSASQDRTVRVWRAEDGVLCRQLNGHAHWVNSLALSVDYVLRTSCFDPERGCSADSESKAAEMAKERYDKVAKNGSEKLVSGSDDFTLFLWDPTVSKQPLCRMTGHQQLVNHVVFSPDTRYIASASLSVICFLLLFLMFGVFF